MWKAAAMGVEKPGHATRIVTGLFILVGGLIFLEQSVSVLWNTMQHPESYHSVLVTCVWAVAGLILTAVCFLGATEFLNTQPSNSVDSARRILRLSSLVALLLGFLALQSGAGDLARSLAALEWDAAGGGKKADLFDQAVTVAGPLIESGLGALCLLIAWRLWHYCPVWTVLLSGFYAVALVAALARIPVWSIQALAPGRDWVKLVYVVALMVGYLPGIAFYRAVRRWLLSNAPLVPPALPLDAGVSKGMILLFAVLCGSVTDSVLSVIAGTAAAGRARGELQPLATLAVALAVSVIVYKLGTWIFLPKRRPSEPEPADAQAL